MYQGVPMSAVRSVPIRKAMFSQLARGLWTVVSVTSLSSTCEMLAPAGLLSRESPRRDQILTQEKRSEDTSDGAVLSSPRYGRHKVQQEKEAIYAQIENLSPPPSVWRHRVADRHLRPGRRRERHARPEAGRGEEGLHGQQPALREGPDPH